MKDILVFREQTEIGDEGAHAIKFVTAGKGSVEWSQFFTELVRIGYDGPLSVHAEYETESQEEFWAKLGPEIDYFRKKRDTALKNAK